jgi:hypothetical protein
MGDDSQQIITALQVYRVATMLMVYHTTGDAVNF